MKKINNIYLIGPMGSGKTSIGIYLAQQLGRPFYDSDQEIEKQAGVDIAWIFEQEGEEGFRKRDNQIIKKLTQLEKIVLSTGGGVILNLDNRKYLSENGIIIHLQTSFEKQLARAKQRPHIRPLLKEKNLEEKLTMLNKQRGPFYKEIANLYYNTDLENPKTIASLIIQQIKEKNFSSLS